MPVINPTTIRVGLIVLSILAIALLCYGVVVKFGLQTSYNLTLTVVSAYHETMTNYVYYRYVGTTAPTLELLKLHSDSKRNNVYAEAYNQRQKRKIKSMRIVFRSNIRRIAFELKDQPGVAPLTVNEIRQLEVEFKKEMKNMFPLIAVPLVEPLVRRI